MEELNNTVTTQGTGLWLADTIPSYFLRSRKSYAPNVDIRLPNIDFLTSNLTIHANAEIAVSNIQLFPSPATISSNSIVFANTFIANVSTILIPLSSVQGLANGYKLVTANIPSAANATIQRIFANASVIIEDLPTNTNVIVSAGESCYFYPKTFSYRNIRKVMSNTVETNLLILALESVDNISIGSLASTANILASVSDDTITTVKKIFRNNNSVLIQNIDANLTVSVGEYVNFSSRPTVGAVRIREEVIYYERLWEANSRLTNLTRNVGKTPNSALTSNVAPGNVISILGLQTVSS
jgi:hypothetical protein